MNTKLYSIHKQGIYHRVCRSITGYALQDTTSWICAAQLNTYTDSSFTRFVFMIPLIISPFNPHPPSQLLPSPDLTTASDRAPVTITTEVLAHYSFTYILHTHIHTHCCTAAGTLGVFIYIYPSICLKYSQPPSWYTFGYYIPLKYVGYKI